MASALVASNTSKIQRDEFCCGPILPISSQISVSLIKQNILFRNNRPLSAPQAADLPEADVGYQGFCPVTLYHSRDRIGLQGKYDPSRAVFF